MPEHARTMTLLESVLFPFDANRLGTYGTYDGTLCYPPLFTPSHTPTPVFTPTFLFSLLYIK